MEERRTSICSTPLFIEERRTSICSTPLFMEERRTSICSHPLFMEERRTYICSHPLFMEERRAYICSQPLFMEFMDLYLSAILWESHFVGEQTSKIIVYQFCTDNPLVKHAQLVIIHVNALYKMGHVLSASSLH